CTRMRRNEIWHQKLLLASLCAEFVKHLLELVIAADTWLHHLGQRSRLGMLRLNLQIATDMMSDEFTHVLGRFHSQVITQTRADKDLLDPLETACPLVHMNERTVIRVQVLTDIRIHTTGFATCRLNLGTLAADPV